MSLEDDLIEIRALNLIEEGWGTDASISKYQT